LPSFKQAMNMLEATGTPKYLKL